jgi:hypothetical protein
MRTLEFLTLEKFPIAKQLWNANQAVQLAAIRLGLGIDYKTPFLLERLTELWLHSSSKEVRLAAGKIIETYADNEVLDLLRRVPSIKALLQSSDDSKILGILDFMKSDPEITDFQAFSAYLEANNAADDIPENPLEWFIARRLDFLIAS